MTQTVPTAVRTEAEPLRVQPPIKGRRILGRASVLGDERLLLAALYLLAVSVRLWGIRRHGFSGDELMSLATAALGFRDVLVALTVEANMSLYMWALFGWLRLVGVGADEGTIRLLSVLLGSAAVPLTYLLGCRLHSRAAGLAGAALLAVNAFHVVLSQEARSYGMFGSLVLLSYLTLDLALTTGLRRYWALHGVMTAVAFYAHFYTAFTLLAQGLFVLSRRSWRHVLGLLLSAIVITVMFAQLVPFFVQQSHGAQLAWLRPLDLNIFLNFLYDLTGGGRVSLAIYCLLAILGVFLGGAASRGAGYRNWMLLTGLLVPIMLVTAISLYRPVFKDRYLLATLPPLVLLAGIGLSRLPRPLGVAAFCVAAWLSLSGLASGFELRRPQEWARAAAYATSSAQSADGWIFIAKKAQNGFEYYAGWHWGRNPTAPYANVLEPFDWRQASGGLEKEYRTLTSRANLREFAATHPRIWLVLWDEFDPTTGADTAAPVRDWLTRNGYAATQRQFRGLRVLFYERRGVLP